MSKEREALKLALEALEEAWYHVGTFQPTEKAIDLYDEARTAIKEALAQPEHGWTPERIAGIARLKDAQDKRLAQPSVSVEQEPVAWVYDPITGSITPPQRKPLTDEEIILIVAECAASHQHTDIHFARAIERAHGIKGLV